MLNCWHSRTTCPFYCVFSYEIKFSVIKNKEFVIVLERDVGLDQFLYVFYFKQLYNMYKQ